MRARDYEWNPAVSPSIYLHRRNTADWLSHTQCDYQHATPYEPAVTLTAATLLDESVTTSEHYRIEPEVANDGRMNSYQLSSEIQSLVVHTDSLLRERAHEIEAIVALRQMKESDTFQKGFMAAAEAPISLTRNLVTDPVGTLESIPLASAMC
ncbi:hypothetical protein [Candidatus Reidiella endopervernicosa]|uniref:Uncharacterized protein n=1 Tax=Candidatus Reidiella endopervernicosa TaxID=2738883 RepID=A0A6N0HWS8_9GAMM|nr:hypothetical protein [Candidatus Reidiella endopervernicosa]QKQ26810.1 hypothetical protein HUE57_11335 [Candidatus Reidiella endopervernicosa]